MSTHRHVRAARRICSQAAWDNWEPEDDDVQELDPIDDEPAIPDDFWADAACDRWQAGRDRTASQ